MATIMQKDNLIFITYPEGGLVALQKEHIIGFQITSLPDYLKIVLHQNTVTINITTGDGWSDVINELKAIITRTTRLKPV